MKKVSIIGAGFVGGTAALRIAESGLAKVALIDVAADIARAKASDLNDGKYSLGLDAYIEGSGDYALIGKSDIIVVTAGLPRKPGMTREDLLLKNADIMSGVCEQIKKYAPEAIVIIVSNPLDVMTYLAFKKLGFPRKRVFGMGVNLDTARFANLISEKLSVGIKEVRALVLGSHGETMLPLPRLSTAGGKPLTDMLNPEETGELVERTKKRGAEIVGLYGSGSAYIGPSAAIFEIVRVILSGEAKEIPVSVCLDGEYGLKDVSIGVLAQIGATGAEKVVCVELNADEQKAFMESAQTIQKTIKTLKLN